MLPETLTALQSSIAHWQRVVASQDEDIGPEHCALCKMFRSTYHIYTVQCDGCPVKASTGNNGCIGTPYQQCEDAIVEHGRDSQEFQEAAEAELEFLKSLLPTC